MYLPSFFEIFIGFVGVVAWTQVLAGRSTAPGWIRRIPWVTAALLLLGQVIAGVAIVGLESSQALVSVARWGSLAGVGVGMVACAGAPLMMIFRPARKVETLQDATATRSQDSDDPGGGSNDSSRSSRSNHAVTQFGMQRPTACGRLAPR